MDNARLQQIYDDAGRPGAQAFRFAVRRAGLEINIPDAKAFVAAQSTGQIFQGRIPSDGVVPGGGREDTRWQIDLIDWSKRIRKLSGKHRFVLVAVENYDRTIFTQPMQNKSAETTLEAFRKIIRANGNVMPKEVTADLGNEWALLEQEIASKGGVLRRKNMQSVNTLAIVDRVVGKLKVILSGYSLTDWAGALKKATAAYNEKSHSYLMGSAPNDVKGSAELQYELDKQNGLAIRHNNEKWRARAGKLRDAGAFRTARPRADWERIDAPKFSGEVHEVDSFKGANVESGDKSFPVSTVLAVPAGSRDVDIGIEAGPGGGRRKRQKEMLQDFATNLKGLLPSTGYTLARVAQILRGMRGAFDTMDVYGPSKQGRIVNFLKLYPNLFSLVGSGPGIKVLPAALPEPRPVQPIQTGGASSSSGGPGGERQLRAIEIDPRAAYRKFPNVQKVRYGANPARGGTPRHGRYEAYKGASTIGEARRLGASSQDISMDIAAGALVLL
jgi:hypothetical protein